MRSLLLVDDSGLFLELQETVLRKTHCRVLTAINGGEALAVARRERPDMILVDAELKGMTGVDLCRVLKADKNLARTPVVIACGTTGQGEEAQRAGVDGVLARPPGEEELFDSIRRYLQVFPRDEARAAAGWSVTFWRDGVQHTGTIRDLSRGGFFVRTALRQPIGARVEVSFEVPGPKPGRTVVAEAIVVRVGQEPDRGLGCRFFRLTARARQHVEECLRMLEMGEIAAR